MLFQIEVFPERDDWRGLKLIDAPFQEALRLLSANQVDQAKQSLSQAVLAAYQAPELTGAHRRIVIEQLKATFKEAHRHVRHQRLGPVPGKPRPRNRHEDGTTARRFPRANPITFHEAFAGLLTP